MIVPIHAGLPLAEVLDLLQSKAEDDAVELDDLEVEVRRIANNDGPVDDYEATTVRQYIAAVERVN